MHGGDADHLLGPGGADLAIALAGYFYDRSRDPAPPGLPNVRAFQRWQYDALLPWLRTRL